MPDQTVNGNLLLATNPGSTTTPLSVSRTDANLPAAAPTLAQISLFGSGTNNLQGTIVLSTKYGATGMPNDPLVERLRIHTDGNVGIGTLAPVNKLDVNGYIAIQGKHAFRGDDDWLRLNQSGNFAAGVHTPGKFAPGSLNVGGAGGWGDPGGGNAWIAGALSVGTTAANPLAKLQVAGGAIMPAAGNSESAGLLFPKDPGGGGGDAAWVRYYPRSGESTTLEIGISNDADDHIALMASGNVGVGTKTPVNKLDVNGYIAIQGKHAFRGDDDWLRLNQSGNFAAGVHTPGKFAPGSLNVGGVGGWGDPGPGNAWIAGTLRIGTNPVLFTSGWSGFPDSTTNQAEISNDTGTYKTLMIVGNKSAGQGRKVSVWDRLEVNGFLWATGGATLNGVAIGANPGAGISMPYPYETIGVTNPAYNLRLHSPNSILLHTGNAGQALVTIDAEGNLGTHGESASPRTSGWGGGIHTWDVEAEGTMWSRHGYGSGPRDLAENYVSEDELEPGDIVSINPEKDTIVKSTGANDPLVLGVISTKPGFELNVNHEPLPEGRHFPVALCGRVPCKVVDEGGPIRKGDLLTSSSTPGHAMKASPLDINGQAVYRPGTIIGKALEVLAGASGTIETFVFSS